MGEPFRYNIGVIDNSLMIYSRKWRVAASRGGISKRSSISEGAKATDGRCKFRRRHAPPGVPGNQEAAVGQVGVRDKGAEKEVEDMARLLPDPGDGGPGVRRGRSVPQGPEGPP